MTDPTVYPLCWPEGWPRSKFREPGKFKVTLASAMDGLKRELRLLGATNVLLSSNAALGADNPRDSGVAAYFRYDGEQTCIPCDRWIRIEHNIQAIAKTIEALRGLERWGAKHMIKAAFRGYQALPPPSSERPWRDVLELREAGSVDRDAVMAAFRRLARERHPDHGGSDSMMADLNTARDRALAELGAKANAGGSGAL